MNNITTSIRDKIREYVLNAAMADEAKISDGSLIFREGYFDSMGFMKMLTFIEENFEVKVNDADLVEENFESINAISKFIVRKQHG